MANATDTKNESKVTLTSEQREALVKQVHELAKQLDVVVVAKSEAIPEAVMGLFNDTFQMQREFNNFSRFLPEAIAQSGLMFAKYIANQRKSEFERLIQKVQKTHQDFNREQALGFIRETRSGKELEELATYAEAVTKKLS